MSNKTTFKRISLAVVAALGFGVLASSPSSAIQQADSLTLSAATATQLTGETATATSVTGTLSFLAENAGDTMSVTASLVSAPAGNTALPVLDLVETTTAVVALTASGGNIAAGPLSQLVAFVQGTGALTTASAKFKVYMNAPTKVGTYVVKLTPAVVAGGGTLNATAQTLTITVSANPATDVVATSATIVLNAGETSSATTDVVVTGDRTASTTVAAATIVTTLKNAAGVTTTGESYTATISGPGILGSGANSGTTITGPNATGRAITVQAGHVVQVFPDGTSGEATVTISSAAGAILGTKSLSFYGAIASLEATVKKPVIAVGSNSAAVEVVAKDAAGVVVRSGTIYYSSSDATKISGAYTSASLSAGKASVDLTGVAAGTAVISFGTKSSAAATTGTDGLATANVRVGSTTVANVSMALDKASYAPNEKATLTVTLVDADGNALADGNYSNIFATGGIVATSQVGNASDTTTATTISTSALTGSSVKTYTIYMPANDGTISFEATTGTGVATANQGVKSSISATVASAATDAAESALDAAQEATDAAIAATDAAILAQEAADEAASAAIAAQETAQAAVDAVTALSAEVTKLVAQLATLQKLLNRVAKKVGVKL